jgi:hypothetical protein
MHFEHCDMHFMEDYKFILNNITSSMHLVVKASIFC